MVGGKLRGGVGYWSRLLIDIFTGPLQSNVTRSIGEIALNLGETSSGKHTCSRWFDTMWVENSTNLKGGYSAEV